MATIQVKAYSNKWDVAPVAAPIREGSLDELTVLFRANELAKAKLVVITNSKVFYEPTWNKFRVHFTGTPSPEFCRLMNWGSGVHEISLDVYVENVW